MTLSFNIIVCLSCSSWSTQSEEIQKQDRTLSVSFYYYYYFFFTYFETVFMCLCGLFSYFDWGTIFFTNPADVLCFLVAWKFILSFDGLSGNEEGKLLARVTMAVLRLVQMIAYLKDGSLYW